MEQPKILVWPEFAWTCQLCFATVKGYESELAARSDSLDHKCEDYKS